MRLMFCLVHFIDVYTKMLHIFTTVDASAPFDTPQQNNLIALLTAASAAATNSTNATNPIAQVCYLTRCEVECYSHSGGIHATSC